MHTWMWKVCDPGRMWNYFHAQQRYFVFNGKKTLSFQASYNQITLKVFIKLYLTTKSFKIEMNYFARGCTVLMQFSVDDQNVIKMFIDTFSMYKYCFYRLGVWHSIPQNTWIKMVVQHPEHMYMKQFTYLYEYSTFLVIKWLD